MTTQVYTVEKHSRLKHKFPGSEEIQRNYSQCHQDLFVLSMLDGKRNGTYFEIGANDPINISNTYLLEKSFDWKGLSIDIVENQHYKLVRKNGYLVADALRTNYLELFEKYEFPKQIDYLSVDIEPSINTFTALKKLPHKDYRFSVITFEHDYYSGDPYNVLPESREFLKSLGYKLVGTNLSCEGTDYPYEDWYVDPNVVSNEIIEKFFKDDDSVINGDTYILNS